MDNSSLGTRGISDGTRRVSREELRDKKGKSKEMNKWRKEENAASEEVLLHRTYQDKRTHKTLVYGDVCTAVRCEVSRQMQINANIS